LLLELEEEIANEVKKKFFLVNIPSFSKLTKKNKTSTKTASPSLKLKNLREKLKKEKRSKIFLKSHLFPVIVF